MISDEQRRWRVAHRHRLSEPRRTNDVATIADDLVALHSSDPATVYLSALVRMQTPSVAAVMTALYDDRSVVRHHAMRRTMWVMTPEVARLAHGAATAKIATAERLRTLKAIDETTDIADPELWLDAATTEVRALLDRHGPLSTRAVGKALPHLVVPMRMGPQGKAQAALNAHTKVLQGAGFNAALVRAAPTGGWNSAEYEWSRTESWLGGPIAGYQEAPAAADLLRRWLLRFGPATVTDMAWWFGWTKTLTRKSLTAIEAIEVQLDHDETGWVHPDDEGDVGDPGPAVRLLPGLDPTIMGWKQRDWYIDPADVGHFFDRFGNAGPVIWADGQIVGAWVQQNDGAILTEVTKPISSHHQRLLSEAIEELTAAIDDVVVRPRFPAPAQRQLLNNG